MCYDVDYIRVSVYDNDIAHIYEIRPVSSIDNDILVYY